VTAAQQLPSQLQSHQVYQELTHYLLPTLPRQDLLPHLDIVRDISKLNLKDLMSFAKLSIYQVSPPLGFVCFRALQCLYACCSYNAYCYTTCRHQGKHHDRSRSRCCNSDAILCVTSMISSLASHSHCYLALRCLFASQ